MGEVLGIPGIIPGRLRSLHVVLARHCRSFFYAVAVPAVLLLGVSKSGFGAGFGSLAVPLMALAIPVPQAAAILMPLLFVMDVMGLAAFRNDFDRKLLRFMLPFAMLGIALGTLLFRLLDAHVVAGIVGASTLLFLAQRLLFAPRADSPPPPRWVGALLLTTSGFTSFIAHAGGRRSMLTPSAQAQAGGLHRHHGFPVLFCEHGQVGALCLAGPAEPRKSGHIGGVAAVGADGGVGGHQGGAADFPAAVLPLCAGWHVPDGLQTLVGRLSLSLRKARARQTDQRMPRMGHAMSAS